MRTITPNDLRPGTELDDAGPSSTPQQYSFSVGIPVLIFENVLPSVVMCFGITAKKTQTF
jgi:hypothetical protein